MINIIRWLIVGFSIVILIACGGGSVSKDKNNTDTVVVNKAPVKKTGQIKSYDKNGTEVTDGSVKDDGYYQAGVETSYTRDDDKEVVIDNITGLMWQDNIDAKTVKKQWLTDDNYDTCHNDKTSPSCKDTRGDTAITYCANLTLGGYDDWRLSTSDELMYIADRSKVNPAISSVFQNVVSDDYWSSTTVVGDEDYVWGVSFFTGYDSWYDKSHSYYMRCVRSNSPILHSFTRDNSTQIVTDSKTGLQWQDNEEAETVKKTWIEAINYCENLTLGDFNDWRLPNFNELYFLADRSKSKPAISSVFQSVVSDGYWSSSTVVFDKDHESGIYFYNGGDYWGDKSDSDYVRCVRVGQ